MEPGASSGGAPRPGLPGSPSTGPSHAVTCSAERSARVSLSAQGKVGGRVGTPLEPRTLKWRPRPQVCPTAGIGGQGCPGARTSRNKLGAFSHIAPSAGPLSRGDSPTSSTLCGVLASRSSDSDSTSCPQCPGLVSCCEVPTRCPCAAARSPFGAVSA